MKHGQVVFFKEAKISTSRKSPAFGFKGHGFGVLLGHVPPFQQDPKPDHMMRLMGTIGFVSFDDVGEMLGAEMGAMLLKKFEEKYWVQSPPVVPDEPQPDPGSQIVS